MFHVIEPPDHSFYSALINPFLKGLQDYPRLYNSFQRLHDATFLLVEDEPGIVYGGAMLLKQRTSVSHLVFRKSLLNFFPLEKEVFIGTVFLRLDKNISQEKFGDITKRFYRALYEDLVALSVKEDVKFFCLILTSAEQATTKIMGGWDYLFEYREEKSSNDLSYTILSLNGKKEAPLLYKKGRSLL